MDITKWILLKGLTYPVEMQLQNIPNKMAQSYYNTVCPFITVKDIEMQIAFLLTVFNGSIKEQLKTPDGKMQFAEVKIGDTVLMINSQKEDRKTNPSANYVFVNNADNVFETALLNGATEITKPDNKFYGMREAGFTDQQGNIWWIAQYLKEVSTQEMEEGFAKRHREEKH
jgi:PhnB protein